MPVGLFISIAARDEMSHGDTFSVAKLCFESTTLPLLTVGCWMSVGFWVVGVDCLGLMRDTSEGTGSGAASDTEPFDSLSVSEDSRRRFRDTLFLITSYDVEVVLEKVSEMSLSDFGDERGEVEFRRTSCGIANRVGH